MIKQDIWMPLYIADYLADTTRLNTEQHGAYLLLIMDYWRNGAPPDDDATLANITKLDIKKWRKYRPLLQKLFKVQDGEWHHKRIDEELIKASANAEKYATRAKKAANKRWNKDATSIPNSNASSIQQAQHEDMLADATSPSPSSIKESINIQETCNSVEISKISSVCIAIKKVYEQYNKPPIDILQADLTLKALVDAGASEQEFIDATEQAIQKGIKNIFKYAVATVKGQRENVKELTLHKGVMPKSTSREQGRHIAAKSIFTPESTQHLRQYKPIEKEVQDEQKQITA